MPVRVLRCKPQRPPHPPAGTGRTCPASSMRTWVKRAWRAGRCSLRRPEQRQREVRGVRRRSLRTRDAPQALLAWVGRVGVRQALHQHAQGEPARARHGNPAQHAASRLNGRQITSAHRYDVSSRFMAHVHAVCLLRTHSPAAPQVATPSQRRVSVRQREHARLLAVQGAGGEVGWAGGWGRRVPVAPLQRTPPTTFQS